VLLVLDEVLESSLTGCHPAGATPSRCQKSWRAV